MSDRTRQGGEACYARERQVTLACAAASCFCLPRYLSSQESLRNLHFADMALQGDFRDLLSRLVRCRPDLFPARPINCTNMQNATRPSRSPKILTHLATRMTWKTDEMSKYRLGRLRRRQRAQHAPRQRVRLYPLSCCVQLSRPPSRFIEGPSFISTV